MGNYALALQFHFEVTVQGLERWYVGHASELAQAGISVRQLREESRTFGPKLETVASQVWRKWLDHVSNPQKSRPAAAPARQHKGGVRDTVDPG